jgi:hypothetical protein
MSSLSALLFTPKTLEHNHVTHNPRLARSSSLRQKPALISDKGSNQQPANSRLLQFTGHYLGAKRSQRTTSPEVKAYDYGALPMHGS